MSGGTNEIYAGLVSGITASIKAKLPLSQEEVIVGNVIVSNLQDGVSANRDKKLGIYSEIRAVQAAKRIVGITAEDIAILDLMLSDLMSDIENITNQSNSRARYADKVQRSLESRLPQGNA